MKNLNVCHLSPNTPSYAENLQTLSHVAFLANRLAKQLSGSERALAYQIKSAALSALILNGTANPNGMRPDATVGLDFLGTRLHCPMSSLSPEAQVKVRRQSQSIPAVAPMSAQMDENQIQNLRDHFPRTRGNGRVN